MKSICLDPTHSTTQLLIERSIGRRYSSDFAELRLTITPSKAPKLEGGLITKGYSKSGYLKTNNNWHACDLNGQPSSQIDIHREVCGVSLPLITVVTVVFNGQNYLEKTIQNVIDQTYPNVEYIVIDGGSIDDTINIIKKYENSIDYWLSESDSGIYDAMNKAIEIATGKWINFMNAGDTFFAPNTLEWLFNAAEEKLNADIIYGNVCVKYKDFAIVKSAGKLNQLWSGMKFCHQSTFVKTSYHKIMKFNPNNKIAADLEFFYRAYKSDVSFQYADFTISSVLTGGLSESNRLKTILASRDAVFNSGGGRLVKLIYYLFFLDVLIRNFLKKILPDKISKKIIQMKN